MVNQGTEINQGREDFQKCNYISLIAHVTSETQLKNALASLQICLTADEAEKRPLNGGGGRILGPDNGNYPSRVRGTLNPEQTPS